MSEGLSTLSSRRVGARSGDEPIGREGRGVIVDDGQRLHDSGPNDNRQAATDDVWRAASADGA
jgi:hypothetical protein